MAEYREITRAEINAFLRSAVILAMAKPEYINGSMRVVDATIIDGSLRLQIDRGDIVYLDFEHLLPPRPPTADAFYGAQCPSYPDCSGGCGLGCTHEIESRRKTCWQCAKCRGAVTHAGKPNFCPYCRSTDFTNVGR